MLETFAKLPEAARERIYYMTEGAALVSTSTPERPT